MKLNLKEILVTALIAIVAVMAYNYIQSNYASSLPQV
jgi:predicted negative regulator of RcsB-dependent stress response